MGEILIQMFSVCAGGIIVTLLALSFGLNWFIKQPKPKRELHIHSTAYAISLPEHCYTEHGKVIKRWGFRLILLLALIGGFSLTGLLLIVILGR